LRPITVSIAQTLLVDFIIALRFHWNKNSFSSKETQVSHR